MDTFSDLELGKGMMESDPVNYKSKCPVESLHRNQGGSRHCRATVSETFNWLRAQVPRALNVCLQRQKIFIALKTINGTEVSEIIIYLTLATPLISGATLMPIQFDKRYRSIWRILRYPGKISQPLATR